MDFKERLARLEERRGQTIDEMMAQHRSEMSASVNDELLRLADVLAQASDDEADIVIDAIGGLEHFPSYHTLAETPLFFTGMESASDVLVRIFDRIIAFIKRWIKVLAESEFRLSVQTAIHSVNLDNFRTEMRTTSRKPKDGSSFLVNTRIQNISVNYRPINNAQNLLNALTVLRAISNSYFKLHSRGVLTYVPKVIEAVNTGKSSDTIAELVLGANPLASMSMQLFKEVETHYESAHMLGNHRFVITDNNKATGDVGERVAGIRIKLEPSQITPTEQLNAVPFQHFDSFMTDAILDKCDSILQLLSESNNSARRHSRRTALSALLAAVERVNNNIKRNGVIDEEETRRIVVVLETYISWLADPYTSFYAYVLRNVKASMNVCVANNE